ncbi:hypothetical protein ACD631_16195 [Alteromonas macleodii]|uniref:hypothetical protein n=1 Tax=Alteromonas macleodii TaxID=28108 RepID=UPI0036F48951
MRYLIVIVLGLSSIVSCASIFTYQDLDSSIINPSRDTSPPPELAVVIRYPATIDENEKDEIKRKLYFENCLIICHTAVKNQYALEHTILKTNQFALEIYEKLRKNFPNSKIILAPQHIYRNANGIYQYKDYGSDFSQFADILLDVFSFSRPVDISAIGNRAIHPYFSMRVSKNNSPKTKGLKVAYVQGAGMLEAEQTWGVKSGLGVSFLTFLNANSNQASHKTPFPEDLAKQASHRLPIELNKFLLLPFTHRTFINRDEIKFEERAYYPQAVSNIVSSVIETVEFKECVECYTNYSQKIGVKVESTEKWKSLIRTFMQAEAKFQSKRSAIFHGNMTEGQFRQLINAFFVKTQNELTNWGKQLDNAALGSLLTSAAQGGDLQAVSINTSLMTLANIDDINSKMAELTEQGINETITEEGIALTIDTFDGQRAIVANNVQELRIKFKHIYEMRY